MSGQDNSTQPTSRDHAGKSSNREGYGFSCPQCNAKFNRLAHLRRHQLTHGGEKPYNCLYCPVASSRKDVIVRHTRNFHPGVANRTGSGHRGRRRTNSHPGATGPATRGNVSTRASPATTTARGDKDHHSEGVNDAAEEHQESPASNGMDGSQSSQENSLDNFLPSHADLFPVCLPENPLSFSAFMEPELVNSNLSDMIDLDILLSNAQEFLGDMPNNNVPELPSSVLEPPRPSLDQTNNNTTDHNSVADDNNCASAWANLTKYPVHILASLRFPSKYAVRRFVKAFFKHIAAHIPIVHEPTFDIATAPSPLLLAIMACGAVYLGEYSTAISMHAVSVQLIFEHERTFASKKFDIETLAWMLQTYLLLSYFEIHCGMEGKAAHAFPHSIKLAQEAIGELKRHQITTYRDWVRQESINRCIASTILIGASIGSKEREEWLASPVVDARFALPSSTAEWLKDEADLEVPTQALYSDDALNSIFSGQEPALPISEFGLVTIVSAILYQVCSFEILTSSHHMELYTNFGEKMGRSVQVLDEILKRRMGEADSGLSPDPSVHCAKSMMNSVYYHLYGSIPLATMKKLLQSPSALDNPEQISNLSDEAASPELYKALLRAADQLRFDCRLGLNYLKKMAPIRFGPECAIGAYEGGLLLCWYLQFAHSRLPQIESRNTLSALINESFAEVSELRLGVQDRLSALPLAVSVELLSDGSDTFGINLMGSDHQSVQGVCGGNDDTLKTEMHRFCWLLHVKEVIALHFHGGNFTVGSKELLVRHQAAKLVDLGFVVVSANYRLSPTITVYEGPVTDALDAYKWTQTMLPGLLSSDTGVSVDGSRIVTLGHSCGATLALLTASLPRPPLAILDIYGIKYLSDPAYHTPFPPLPGSPKLEEDFVGRIWKDIPPPTSAPPPMGPSGPDFSNYRVAWMFEAMGKGTLLKTTVGDDNYDRVDPVSLFSKGHFPPTYFIHGTEDRLVPARLSQRAHSELKSHGVETELALVEGGQHGLDEKAQPGDGVFDVLTKGFEFLKAHV
ncbi:hypothetical protein FDECE_12732 [Fusarium decemcellulare]|nr:hypothetical protein FDECE_12732 [Fusarium decemcellulare]